MARLTELAHFLRAHDDYALFAHVNPDGDAVGSCIALALALQSLGKRTVVCVPGGVPHTYDFSSRTVPVVADAKPDFTPRTAFAVDVSEYGRLGNGQLLYERCPHSAMLDHHATNPGFGEVYFVDGNAAACGELAVELIEELGVPLSEEMARWLYIAISTDSGRFGYSSTRAETMIAAAACLRAGIDVDAINRELYRTRSEGRVRMMGLVFSDMGVDAERGLAWSRATLDMFRRAHALHEDNEDVVNYLLEIRGMRLAVLAEEREDGTKFSLRARPPLDVARDIAVPLGGGGHANAAGFTLKLPVDEALAQVLERARALLDRPEGGTAQT